MESVLLDVAGHRRSPATMPGYHRGRPPRNKGEQYPADPPSALATEERSAEGVGILHATRPAPVGPGDELEIAIGTARRTVIVRGAAARRVSAAEAVILGEETEESAAERRRGAELRRLAGPVDFGGRLTQRDRRRCEAGRQ